MLSTFSYNRAVNKDILNVDLRSWSVIVTVTAAVYYSQRHLLKLNSWSITHCDVKSEASEVTTRE